MSFEYTLTLKGYNKSISEGYKTFKSTNTLFQKRIRDEKGTRYFINAWWYPADIIREHKLEEAIQIDVQFYSKGCDAVMDVTLFEKDLDKAEEMLDAMWNKLEFGYYELDEVW